MKILIIKLGYSETLDSEIGNIVSLGDVLRTTPLLEALKQKYENSSITWLVTEKAAPLLVGNYLIDRVLVVDEFTPFQLMREQYDIVINLEKNSGVCALADSINAWAHYGFRFDVVSGRYHAYEKGEEFLEYINNKNVSNHVSWQQNLIQMLGLEWKEQKYSLGYQPATSPQYDVGLNYLVGSKWPTKKMPHEKWELIANLLEKNNINISWQQGENNLYDYMDWISACKVLLTHDSLGLHLGLALGKKVVALFGPTNASEVYFYDLGQVIRAENFICMPCNSGACKENSFCMDNINVEKIVKIVKNELGCNNE